MMNIKLSIVIVNYNVKFYLHQCLHSVQRALAGINAEVIVVDNASTDGSLDELTLAYPDVVFIANTDNKGYAYANNQAIRQSHGEYVLLLNPDTIVGGEVFDTCVSFLDTHPNVGAVGVRMLRADGSFAYESRRGLPTPLTAFYKMVGLCSLFPKSKFFGKYYMRYLDENEAARIEVISGAFMMLRRSALDEVGLLDETFFMYGEDIDLSYRLLLGGYSNYYLPCSIIHYKGESTKKTSFRYVRNFYNAMLIFYDKHFAKKHRWLTLLVRMGIYFMGISEFLIRQRYLITLLFTKLTNRNLQTNESKRILVVGKQEMCHEIEHIAKKNNLLCDYIPLNQHDEEENSLPLAQISECKSEHEYERIVFDSEHFNYSEILTFIQRESLRKERSGESLSGQMELGLYSTQTHRLIFASHSYEWDGNVSVEGIV